MANLKDFPDYKQFISLLKDAVKFYPETLDGKIPVRYKRPSTFYSIPSIEYIGTSNNGVSVREADKPYFYNRSWQKNNYNPSKIEITYPAVYLLENGIEFSNPFGNAFNYNSAVMKKEVCHTFQMLVVDTWSDTVNKKGEADDRTINDVFCDTENIAHNILYSLTSLVCAVIYDEENTAIGEGWFYLSELEHLVQQEKILHYEIDQLSTKRLRKSLRENNVGMKATRMRLESNLMGTMVTFKFCGSICYGFKQEIYGGYESKYGWDQGCC